MAFKPNYSFQKAERDRAKQAKKEAKQREKDDAKRRVASGEPEPAAAAGSEGGPVADPVANEAESDAA